MSRIHLLDSETINKIAAGEVIERPASIVKELVENSIDSGATQISIEIKNGGISFLRVTDNGCGIAKEDVENAFLRHATSKITNSDDLFAIESLGFRGEALASIASVSHVELLTKRDADFLGTRYTINGGIEESLSECGCPNGTTFLIRDVFYNVPARRKFLKSGVTEAGYIMEFISRIAVSHPEISFSFVNSEHTALYTPGNGVQKDAIYSVYGREIASNLIPVSTSCEAFSLEGFIGKPQISRGNRTYENYFVNGRYVRSSLLSKAIEEAYKPYVMQHKFPFTVLSLTFDPASIDVNVHPTKMEVRINNGDAIYDHLVSMIGTVIRNEILIPKAEVEPVKKPSEVLPRVPEVFEENRRKQFFESERPVLRETVNYETKTVIPPVKPLEAVEPPKQMELFEAAITKEEENTAQFMKKTSEFENYRIVGQLFRTYWLIELEDELFLIDQHAAHEKILYERTVAAYKNHNVCSQQLCPPIILTLSLREENTLQEHFDAFTSLGFEIEHFGGHEYQVRALPVDLFRLTGQDLLLDVLDQMVDLPKNGPSDLVLERIASMSCKAAIKGNMDISELEAKHLIEELLTLENPYHCPHGRPIIVRMSKYELEKKFKRII